ncbi:uncharacterized protein K441DRAFT_253585 [Cenococcum geophilum 1.58]|uniref:uncharacterized protein n=1 Tax=Cenococcum geophilum 1.58 TaxID=794803 RepID=UPI00358E2A9F|nr:hypothetical protein K441DRAFT_253585 [Cenococcum geophilum 1.58]
MALNPPPLKLCNCANFALNNINEFTKGQGYTVSKFSSKTDSRGRGRRALSRGGSSQISSSTALQITAQSTQSTPEQVGSIIGSITGGITGGNTGGNSGRSQDTSADGLPSISGRLTVVVGPCPFSTTLLRGPLVHSSFNLNSTSYTIVEIKT